ncbi:hypothetical protein ACSELD_005056, partial [Escherichia coli]
VFHNRDRFRCQTMIDSDAILQHNTNPGQKKQGPERKSGTEKFHADVFPLLIVNEVSLTGNGSDAVF